eukprot:CAMPEP_0201489740 /NCGR_PEP_ID=MMETSP0151_2-20130828/23503_1 /ASSEMBLY_ACC=CAM_ASM_000257 /TAXON_ID=200890 /ORGANISM="Paramoeba atlantica, Strain 621/1 / CCAP 1560/9" /LENGTH=151 /DNA_ID=CAMNT_0047875427 /DNA_START=199 /DNA_END=655 /DNA_ORIENTATION=-
MIQSLHFLVPGSIGREKNRENGVLVGDLLVRVAKEVLLPQVKKTREEKVYSKGGKKEEEKKEERKKMEERKMERKEKEGEGNQTKKERGIGNDENDLLILEDVDKQGRYSLIEAKEANTLHEICESRASQVQSQILQHYSYKLHSLGKLCF